MLNLVFNSNLFTGFFSVCAQCRLHFCLSVVPCCVLNPVPCFVSSHANLPHKSHHTQHTQRLYCGHLQNFCTQLKSYQHPADPATPSVGQLEFNNPLAVSIPSSPNLPKGRTETTQKNTKLSSHYPPSLPCYRASDSALKFCESRFRKGERIIIDRCLNFIPLSPTSSFFLPSFSSSAMSVLKQLSRKYNLFDFNIQ
jgi:hypothetical protein